MLQSLFEIFSFVALTLSAFYVLIIVSYRSGWKRLPQFTLISSPPISTKISVLVPARNEEENINKCLQSLTNQSLSNSLYEIIVIDDHSEDKTPDLVKAFNHPQVKLLQLADFVSTDETQSFKKKAIEIGIKHANGDLIVTTDADCIVGTDWLRLMASFYETTGAKFIAAPVIFHKEQNSLQYFQTLDFLGMMCVTGAGIHTGLMHMCNGANLAYEKAAFYSVKGFEGIDDLASGDDMLLMQKIAKRYPQQIGFLKQQDATVRTEAKADLRSFASQRIRWGTKSSSYQEWQVTAILAAVFFHCWSILLSFLLIPFFGKIAFALFLAQLIIKSSVDFLYLNMMAKWFDRRDVMRHFVKSEILHILYIAGIGLAANIFKTYEWKGRKVR